MTKKVLKTTDLEPIVYAGPSLPNNLLKQNSVFANGILPTYVQEYAADEDFSYFLIKTSKLGELLVKLKNKSSIESIKFNALAIKLKGAK